MKKSGAESQENGELALPDFGVIEKCSRCLNDPGLRETIHERCVPVPAFGDVRSPQIRVATLGLNPSSTEFFAGERLRPRAARLPHLDDYGVASRAQLAGAHLEEAARRRAAYFGSDGRTPHPWFTRLTALLDACGRNWAYESGNAVHVDIVACTTTTSWGKLPPEVTRAMSKNCSSHLEQTLALLPPDALLLGDGPFAGDTLAGTSKHWWEFCEFSDGDGTATPVRIRSGISSAVGGGRRFYAWNPPAKYLSDDALAKVARCVSNSVRRSNA
jgi:hypothetical protein